jgi:hypothetical protein
MRRAATAGQPPQSRREEIDLTGTRTSVSTLEKGLFCLVRAFARQPRAWQRSVSVASSWNPMLLAQREKCQGSGEYVRDVLLY